jgi:hypothetical protein
MIRKSVRQKTGAGDYFHPQPNAWHCPFKARYISRRNLTMKESSSYLDHWVALFFSLHNWSSLTKIFSSFPSLQDNENVTVINVDLIGRVHTVMKSRLIFSWIGDFFNGNGIIYECFLMKKLFKYAFMFMYSQLFPW